MAKIRVVIADDEPLARENLESLLEREPDVEIVARCATGAETVAVIREAQPDVAFLDLKMPEGAGFDVVAELDRDRIPVVVFVTAFDEYAVEAFESRALDYLLKPVSDERFARALARVRERLSEDADLEFAQKLRSLIASHGEAPAVRGVAHGPAPAGTGYPERIRVQSRARTYFVPTRDILWIEADAAGVLLHTRTDSHEVRCTLAEMEGQLDPSRWVRVHRSHIVDLQAIREIQPYFHGDYIVILEDRTELRVSRRRREAIRKLMGE